MFVFFSFPTHTSVILVMYWIHVRSVYNNPAFIQYSAILKGSLSQNFPLQVFIKNKNEYESKSKNEYPFRTVPIFFLRRYLLMNV
jgi:hypothetical protein